MYLIICLIVLYFVLSSIFNVLIHSLLFIGRRRGSILVEILKLVFITICLTLESFKSSLMWRDFGGTNWSLFQHGAHNSLVNWIYSILFLLCHMPVFPLFLCFPCNACQPLLWQIKELLWWNAFFVLQLLKLDPCMSVFLHGTSAWCCVWWIKGCKYVLGI